MDILETLTSIGLGLTAALSATDKYNRLLKALSSAIPFDAATLLRLDKDDLIPIATYGLAADALGRRYSRREHPRLDIICKSKEPIRFPFDSALPDPFDGLLIMNQTPLAHIHDCLGCPLFVKGKLVGALTADALNKNAFKSLDKRFLQAVSALAAAHMQTADLIDALEKSARHQGMIVKDLMRDVHLRQGDRLIGISPVMGALKKEIELVAQSDFTVLITGETGVGKELVARAIHLASIRNQEPILYLNCAALSETLAESELFGHIKGAFTGASQDRAGKFELANGGTLFLDEIGELPLSIQPKLLRAIQEGDIQRVGSNKSVYVNVRLLAATNRQLEKEVENKKFRADLFHRLNVYPIRVAPLRERIEDIPVLAGHFSDIIRRKLGIAAIRIEPRVLSIFQSYVWPGNVRELENVISRCILKAFAQSRPELPVIINASHLDKDMVRITENGSMPEGAMLNDSTGVCLNEAVDQFKRETILRFIEKNNGNWAAAARDLGLHRSNLHHLAKRLGINPKKMS